MTNTSPNNEPISQWVLLHGRAVRGYLLAMVRRVDVADDLLQEVFQRAWQARERYQESGAARGYLLRIADRLVVDRARSQAREINVGSDVWEQVEPAAEAEPANRLLAAESRRELEAALEKLTPMQRRVLLLRYYSEMDFVEIAEVIGVPLNTALSHCRRGLLALRRTMAGSEAENESFSG